MTFDLKNKTALVTGAGRGIGKAIALKLAACGAKVICVSKTHSCEQVAAQIVAQGGLAQPIMVDVADALAVQQACEKIIQEHTRVDIIVNNAGITKDNLILRMSPEDWHAVINTNLSSAFYWTKYLVQPMTKSRWGRIINISSVVGVMGNAGQANYSAAKAGMIGLTKALAKELASRNITANVVTPGWIETDMTSHLDPAVAQEVIKHVPLKRFGKPEDIANMVAFIASDQAAYITGKTFSVDGGLVMH